MAFSRQAFQDRPVPKAQAWVYADAASGEGSANEPGTACTGRAVPARGDDMLYRGGRIPAGERSVERTDGAGCGEAAVRRGRSSA